MQIFTNNEVELKLKDLVNFNMRNNFNTSDAEKYFCTKVEITDHMINAYSSMSRFPQQRPLSEHDISDTVSRNCLANILSNLIRYGDYQPLESYVKKNKTSFIVVWLDHPTGAPLLNRTDTLKSVILGNKYTLTSFNEYASMGTVAKLTDVDILVVSGNKMFSVEDTMLNCSYLEFMYLSIHIPLFDAGNNGDYKFKPIPRDLSTFLKDSTPSAPVYRYRYFENNEHTVTFGQYSDWKECDKEEYNGILNYIEKGYTYECEIYLKSTVEKQSFITQDVSEVEKVDVKTSK